MTDTFIDIPTEVDELNLSMRGCTATDFRARLLVPDHSRDSGEFAKLTVSYRARFNVQDWSDRFRELERDSYTPPLVVMVSEPSLSPVPTLVEHFEQVRNAERGSTKTMRPDYLGAPARWRPPGDLTVSLTSYDSADLSMSDFDLYRPVKCPIETVDETNPAGLYRLSDVSVQLLRPLDRDHDGARLRIDGVAVVDQKAAREPKSKYDYREIYPPELRIEVLDETGFPMVTTSVDPMSYPVRTDLVPRRAGSWVTETGLDLHAKPSRIIVRIVDNDSNSWDDDAEPDGPDDEW